MTEGDQNFSSAEAKAREDIVALLKTALGAQFKPELIIIDYPPESKLGDYTVPCFSLVKILKDKPAEVASSLAKKIKPAGLVVKVQAAGPYLNFFIDQIKFNQLVLTQISQAKRHYGQANIGKGKQIMVEYFSPNTNKPLTIGHLRNICLGFSLSELLKFFGYKVITATLYNDRGIAITKTIVGYQKWGANQTPKKAGLKPDHFVGNFYTKFVQEAKTNPELEKEAQRVLRGWEKGDKRVMAVWQKLISWVLEGFAQTLKKIKIADFDKKYYESEFYQAGREIVEKGLKDGVFVRDKDGVILAPLTQYNLPDKIVLRPDDTSLYVTQDLYLAFLKDQNQLDQSIYVVGNEQDLYFKQLFKILELLGFGSLNNYHHLSYGMIRLPGGKIKSREGLVKGTGADELMAELQDLAREEIISRDSSLSQKELAKRAEQIALGALKFYILSVDPKKTMVFDPKESLAFSGKTGPYLQYVHARIASLFARAKFKPSARVDFKVLNHQLEREIIKLLSRFPSVIAEAISSYSPAILANYLYQLAQTFSLFYEQVPVLKAEAKTRKARLFLLHNVQIVLANGLKLLGIEMPEKM